MSYYDYWRDYYKSCNERDSDLDDLRGVIEHLQEQGYQTYNAIVDNLYEKTVLIYEHIDPIEGKANDFRAICLDNENIHWGNVIDTQDGRFFIAITRNDWNGAYNKYKIRELTDDIRFDIDEEIHERCVVADKGLYDEISYINDANVFEEKDTRAVILQYNDNTSKLTLFDDVFVNEEMYKIVKIDTHTFKEYDEDFGVTQLVMIDTTFGEIRLNEDEVLKGVLIPARVKDKILNSISMELLCYHNKVKRGDYIDFEYDRDKNGDMVIEKYIIVNKPTMGSGYDNTLLHLCESRMNLLNNEGGIVNVGVYFENNRMRIDRTTEGEFAKIPNSSFMILVQNNDTTSRVSTKDKYNRVIIDGKPYEVTGIDDSAKGILYIGLNNSQFDPNDDDVEKGIANYKTQINDINKDVAPEPDITNVCIIGEGELVKGYTEYYYLEGSKGKVEWSVDCDYITINQDGDRCGLTFNTFSDANKTFTLTATYMGDTFTKTIRTKRI